MIIIYGKNGCKYCDMALQLVEDNKLPYEYKKLGRDFTIEQFQEQFPGVKTVPAVTTYGMYIGGYDDLVSYVEENSNETNHERSIDSIAERGNS